MMNGPFIFKADIRCTGLFSMNIAFQETLWIWFQKELCNFNFARAHTGCMFLCLCVRVYACGCWRRWGTNRKGWMQESRGQAETEIGRRGQHTLGTCTPSFMQHHEKMLNHREWHKLAFCLIPSIVLGFLALREHAFVKWTLSSWANSAPIV